MNKNYDFRNTFGSSEMVMTMYILRRHQWSVVTRKIKDHVLVAAVHNFVTVAWINADITKGRKLDGFTFNYDVDFSIQHEEFLRRNKKN